MYSKEEFEELAVKLDPKGKQNAYKTLVSLGERLNAKGIEDKELDDMFTSLKESLNKYLDGDKSQRKIGALLYSDIRKHVRIKYRMHKKGSLTALVKFLFILPGIAVGMVFFRDIASIIWVGVIPGVVVGMLVGAQIEKKVREDDRIY